MVTLSWEEVSWIKPFPVPSIPGPGQTLITSPHLISDFCPTLSFPFSDSFSILPTPSSSSNGKLDLYPLIETTYRISSISEHRQSSNRAQTPETWLSGLWPRLCHPAAWDLGLVTSLCLVFASVGVGGCDSASLINGLPGIHELVLTEPSEECLVHPRNKWQHCQQ